MNESYSYKIALRVLHPLHSAEEISVALEMRPDLAYSAGDPKATPTGVPLGGLRANTSWVRDFETLGDALEDKLVLVVGELELHRSFFVDLRRTGGSAELFIGWFLEGNTGFELAAPLMEKLATLGLQLSFDMYAG